MSTVYIARADPRENHEAILGVYKEEKDAKICLGQYHRKFNDDEDLSGSDCLNNKKVLDMSMEELGVATLNDWSCITGWIETHEVLDKAEETE